MTKQADSEAYNGPHKGQKYVGYNTKRSAGSLRIFVPANVVSEFMRLLNQQ